MGLVFFATLAVILIGQDSFPLMQSLSSCCNGDFYSFLTNRAKILGVSIGDRFLKGKRFSQIIWTQIELNMSALNALLKNKKKTNTHVHCDLRIEKTQFSLKKKSVYLTLYFWDDCFPDFFQVKSTFKMYSVGMPVCQLAGRALTFEPHWNISTKLMTSPSPPVLHVYWLLEHFSMLTCYTNPDLEYKNGEPAKKKKNWLNLSISTLSMEHVSVLTLAFSSKHRCAYKRLWISFSFFLSSVTLRICLTVLHPIPCE